MTDNISYTISEVDSVWLSGCILEDGQHMVQVFYRDQNKQLHLLVLKPESLRHMLDALHSAALGNGHDSINDYLDHHLSD